MSWEALHLGDIHEPTYTIASLTARREGYVKADFAYVNVESDGVCSRNDLCFLETRATLGILLRLNLRMQVRMDWRVTTVALLAAIGCALTSRKYYTIARYAIFAI